MVKVSVITTAYNCEEYIEQSMRSALAQSLEDIELVVVIDKPTDGTAEIVKLISAEDSRVLVIENEKNLGAGKSRKVGIDAASGEYIAFLDGDDWLEESALEALYNAAKENDADISGGNIAVRSNNGYYEVMGLENRVLVGYEKVQRYWGKVLTMCNRIYRRTLFNEIPYCERRYIEDFPTAVKLMWRANKVVSIDKLVTNYRMNPKSLTHTCTPVKDLIFRTLAWLDVVEFFNERDKEIYKHIKILDFSTTIFGKLAEMNISEKDIEPYKEEWCEMSRRLFNITQILKIQLR